MLCVSTRRLRLAESDFAAESTQLSFIRLTKGQQWVLAVHLSGGYVDEIGEGRDCSSPLHVGLTKRATEPASCSFISQFLSKLISLSSGREEGEE